MSEAAARRPQAWPCHEPCVVVHGSGSIQARRYSHVQRFVAAYQDFALCAKVKHVSLRCHQNLIIIGHFLASL